MCRLIAFVFILTSLLTLGLGASLAIGHAQPPRPEVALLHLGDYCALPCWIGITPGKTTFGEGIQRIKEVYGNLSAYSLDCDSQLDSCALYGKSKEFRLDIDMMTNSGTRNDQALIDYVRLAELDALTLRYLLSAGDLASKLGGPQLIAFDSHDGSNYGADLVYVQHQINIFFALEGLPNSIVGLGNPVYAIGLRDRFSKQDLLSFDSFRGFGVNHVPNP